jgi:hypothetical protein
MIFYKRASELTNEKIKVSSGDERLGKRRVGRGGG